MCLILVKELYERFKEYKESFPTSYNHIGILPLIFLLERSKTSKFSMDFLKSGKRLMLQDDKFKSQS